VFQLRYMRFRSASVAKEADQQSDHIGSNERITAVFVRPESDTRRTTC